MAKKKSKKKKNAIQNKRKLTPSAHDRYIRGVMTNPRVVRDFFEATLPVHIRSAMDLDAIKLQKDSFINDKLKLQVADLLYSVNIQGKPGYLYVLLEHASTPDRMLAFRMLKYMVSIMDEHMKNPENKVLPVIYPMVLYTGKRPFKHSMDLFDLFGKNRDMARSIYKAPYHLVDLTHGSDEELDKYRRFHAAALFMRHIYDANILPVLGQAMELLKELEAHGEFDYIQLTMTYIMDAGRVPNLEEFTQTVTQGLSHMEEDDMLTLGQQLRAEGRKQAREELLTMGQQLREEGRKQAREEMKAEAEEQRMQVAKNLIANLVPLETVEKCTGIPVAVLKRLPHEPKEHSPLAEGYPDTASLL